MDMIVNTRATVWRYDVVKHKWLSLACMPTARTYHVAGLYCGSTILVAGG